MLKDEFDNIVSDLVNKGQPDKAIMFTEDFIVHASSALAGIYYGRLNKIEDATQVLSGIIQFIDNPYICNNLAFMFLSQNKYEEALGLIEKGLQLPNPPDDLYYNKGLALKNLARYPEAEESFRIALSLQPNSPVTHCQLSDVLIVQGKFDEGLKEGWWRFETNKRIKQFRKRYNKPDWNGEKGKKILIFNEAEFGDAIQFSGYITAFKELTEGHIIFEAAPEIYNLYLNFPAIDELIEYNEKGTPQVEYDYVIAVSDLPCFVDPNLEKLPFSVPYITPQKREIPINCDKVKIGIVWAGYQFHDDDNTRSCMLKFFKPLSELENVQLFSLQKGPMVRTWPKEKTGSIFNGIDDIKVVDLIEDSEVDFIDLAPQLNDFNDTANALQSLDVLVSVSTSIVPLAGALDVPVFLLLSYAYEWRWQRQWYPNVSIFRQESEGDWKSLLETVATTIKAQTT